MQSQNAKLKDAFLVTDTHLDRMCASFELINFHKRPNNTDFGVVK